MSDLDALSALAEAAENDLGPSEWWGMSHSIARNPDSREYINAVDPATVLALIARVKRAEAALTVEHIAVALHRMERLSTIDPAQCINGPEFDRTLAARFLSALNEN
jgi:hypothetical protein